MKKIGLFILYTLFFVAALLFFTPKENLYYYAEEQLKPLGVVIGYEEAIDHGFSLEIQHAKLYIQKIKSANISTTHIALYGLYNSVSIENIVLDKTFEQFFPPLIEQIDIYQNVFSPMHIKAEARGDFGEANATVNLLERSAAVTLRPSKMMLSRYKNTLRQLKRSKEGGYHYEYKF